MKATWILIFFSVGQSTLSDCRHRSVPAITITPPLWTDLVKISRIKLRHASSFSLERPDFEKIHWAPSEDAEVAEVKRPRNSKRQNI